MDKVVTRTTARGFTAIEMMITLAIFSILASVALASLNELVNESRLRSTIIALSSDMNLAKSEAIKRSSRVLVVANGGNWSNGWSICYDANSDNVCDPSTAVLPNPIRQAQALNRMTLSAAGGMARVVFNGVGNSTGFTNFTLSGNWSGSSSRFCTVALSGAVSSGKL